MTDDYDTEAARDGRAEDRAGAAAMPEPTPQERSQIQRWMQEILAEQTDAEREELAAQLAYDEGLRDLDADREAPAGEGTERR